MMSREIPSCRNRYCTPIGGMRIRNHLFSSLLLLGVTQSTIGQVPLGSVVKYHVTMKDVKYVYGPAEPVAHLNSGDILETNTVDAFGNAIQKPGDTLNLVKGDNPLTGPFYIEGA